MSARSDYAVAEPPPPSAPKLFLDTRVVPLAVNVAAALEAALERTAVRTGVRPSVILAGVAGLAVLLAVRGARRRAGAR